jgi:hypothetical protein
VKAPLESNNIKKKNTTGFSNWRQVVERKTENYRSKRQKGKKHLKTSESML